MCRYLALVLAGLAGGILLGGAMASAEWIDDGAPQLDRLAAAAPLTVGQPTPLTPPVPPPDVMPMTLRPPRGPEGVRPPEGVERKCPETRYVNCMPPVQGTARSMCSAEYLKWAKANCPKFEVVY
jgi:hypothetical protein